MGEDGPMATLLLLIMGSFAELERALIREGQVEGLALARQYGVSRETLHQHSPAG